MGELDAGDFMVVGTKAPIVSMAPPKNELEFGDDEEMMMDQILGDTGLIFQNSGKVDLDPRSGSSASRTTSSRTLRSSARERGTALRLLPFFVPSLQWTAGGYFSWRPRRKPQPGWKQGEYVTAG